MKLKSFGCSFIFGSDLADCNPNPPVPQHSCQTWPALLAQYLNFEYHCYARPGAGNLQIAERILNQLTVDEPAFYVVSWTWIDRFDYYTQQDNWQPWSTCKPGDETTVSKLYYKNLHSEYHDKLSNLIYIKTIIDLFDQKNISFLMTYTDELLFDQRWNCSPAVIDLQNHVKSRMMLFDNQTFLDWSRNQKFVESKNWHPLEKAHQSAADYVITLFDKQKTSDLAQQVRV